MDQREIAWAGNLWRYLKATPKGMRAMANDDLVVTLSECGEDPALGEIEMPCRFEVCSVCRGVYDVVCAHCEGTRVELAVDRAKLGEDGERLMAFIDSLVTGDYSYARECAMERMLGCKEAT